MLCEKQRPGGQFGCLNASGKWSLVGAYMHISQTIILQRSNAFYTYNIYIN